MSSQNYCKVVKTAAMLTFQNLQKKPKTFHNLHFSHLSLSLICWHWTLDEGRANTSVGMSTHVSHSTNVSAQCSDDIRFNPCLSVRLYFFNSNSLLICFNGMKFFSEIATELTIPHSASMHLCAFIFGTELWISVQYVWKVCKSAARLHLPLRLILCLD